MKLLCAVFAIVAVVAAGEVPSSDYLPPSNDYLPPTKAASVAVQHVAYAPQESAFQQVSYAPQESAVLANDGYRYKTVRRLRYRHRRDVNELPSNDYLPPAEAASVAVEQVAYAPQEAALQHVDYAPQESVVQQVSYAPQESAALANDGYRYKTVRRLRYRHRRDVNELPSNDYLPPAEAASVAVEQVGYAPQESAVHQVSYAPQESAVLANDGYRYKTIRRLRYRHRRDVNEIPSNDYLPPAEAASVAVEQVGYAPQESAVQQVSYAPQESAVLANDGYRYKTVRRLRYRHRRDVNELPSNDYLPPSEAASIPVEQVSYAPQESVIQHIAYAPQESAVQQVSYAPQESAVLSNDGYRYKTVRRLRYRHRRDVNELPSNDYLPPAEAASVAVQQVAYAPQESAVQHVAYAPQESAVQQVSYAPQESAILTNDGYRYKAVRRLKYRRRRV
ncbi:uncharacterized protein [Eurosta solidaginis]|uniref:uncharacterized protein n=1 Tax=Eurosta solidaginis TaxID=178769 RepID=UPI003530ABF9